LSALTGKRLELLTPNLVHVYSIAVTQHALTHKSKGKGQGHAVTKTARSHGCQCPCIPHIYTPLCYLRPLPAWICVSICRNDCLCFLVRF